MNKAFVVGKSKIVIKNITLPPLKNDEVLIKIILCGICGSDLKRFISCPESAEFSIGHEVLGIVESTGVNCKKLIGQYVSIRSTIPCKTCEHCLQHREKYCLQPLHQNDIGGFAEYTIVNQQFVFPINSTPRIEHVLLEPLSVALSVIKNIRFLGSCQRIAVSGAGTIGLLIAWQLTKYCEYPIILLTNHIDGRAAQLACAMGIQVHSAYDFPESQLDVILATSDYDTIPQLLKSLRIGGRLVTIGFQGYKSNLLSLNMEELHRKSLCLQGCYAHPQMYFEDAAYTVTQSSTLLKDMLSPVFSLAQVQHAFEVAKLHIYSKTIVGENNYFTNV